MTTLTKKQLTWVQDCLNEELMNWSHPDGDDAHLYMSEEDYHHSACDYFYQLRDDRDRVEQDWGEVLSEVKEYFEKEFGTKISKEKIFTIFMDCLAEHCLN